MCARSQADLKKSHLNFVKRIMCYEFETTCLDCGTLRILVVRSWGTLILIGHVMWKIGRIPMVDVSMLVKIWSLGLVRKNIVFLYPMLKRSTLLLEQVVNKCCG